MPIFFSCRHYRRCGQIVHAETFGEFRTWRYGLRSSTWVPFKFQEGKKKLCTSVEIFVECQSDPVQGGLPCIYFWPPNSPQQAGVCPVGVGETWRRLFTECVLKFTVPKATNSCQYDQSCAGLKAGIIGASHWVQDIWDSKSST